MSRVVDLLLTLWRGAVIGLWHGLIAIPSALLVLLVPNGGAIGHALFARFWGRVTLAGCGIPWTVEGAERVEPGRAYVFAANHASEFDFYAIAGELPFQWRALMRPGLGRIPVYGWVARRTGHVFLRLTDPDRRSRAYGECLAQLARGRSLLVFPEGRRPGPGAVAPFKRGAFGIAIEAGVPVVPIAVEEILRRPPRRCLGRGLGHRVARLRVVILPPIETKDLDPEGAESLGEQVRRAVMDAHLGAVNRGDPVP
ncbi:MAG: 1-acyl-sn-glycerol-3-phosphate acyltransferase [Myxococcales bacterium]|nr:1-acyl-sn-glycerol-3-phosphate acyltransferase [Myxococcales bacterium]